MGSRIYFLILFAALTLPAHAGNIGFASKARDLFDRPDSGAKTVGRIAKQQSLEIISREGSWAKVRSANASGWIPLVDLRLDRVNSRQPTVARPRPSNNSGIRGFSEEELLVGAPNEAEAAKLKTFGVAPKDAAGFARAAGLKSRQQDYIEMQDFMPQGGFPEGFFDE